MTLGLAWVSYRVSIDPQESAITRLAYRILARRSVRSPWLSATAQARVLAVLFLGLAVLGVVLVLVGVETKTFGR